MKANAHSPTESPHCTIDGTDHLGPFLPLLSLPGLPTLTQKRRSAREGERPSIKHPPTRPRGLGGQVFFMAHSTSYGLYYGAVKGRTLSAYYAGFCRYQNPACTILQPSVTFQTGYKKDSYQCVEKILHGKSILNQV